MDKDSKISLLFSDKTIYNYAYKVAKGNDLYKDIVSEIIIYFYELSVEDFEKIKDLKSYACKMIYYSWNSATSPFYKKYKNDRDFTLKDVFLLDEEDEKESNHIDIIEFKKELTQIEKNISQKRFPCEVRLCELYLEMKSYRAVANLLGIPATTVHYQVNKVISEMKNKI